MNNSGSYTQFLYAPSGYKVEIMNGQTLVRSFMPLPGGAMAYGTSSAVYFRHPDWLGSSRFESTMSRTMYSDVAYAPFGESYAQSGTTDLSFTGMDQDTAANFYDFPAREYNSAQGRWPSPDPAGLAAVDSTNPQSWNRYAYVTNRPLTFVDPLGLCGGPPGLVTSFMNGQLLNAALNVSLPCGGGGALFGGKLLPFLPVNGESPIPPSGGWWSNFGNAFLNGVLHGVRQPGQSFGACVLQNANETTGGAHQALVGAVVVTASAAISNVAQVTVQGAGTVSGDPGTVSLTAAIALNLGRLVYMGSGGLISGLTVIRPVATVIGAAGNAAPYVAAAEAGLLIGSAINCR